MANGLAKGYTKLSNMIMEDIMREDFTKREYKVLLWVFRYGYGFNKEQSACDLDVKKIAHDTGLDRSHVWKTLRLLESKNIIKLAEDIIRFNRHGDEWTMAKTALKKVRPKQPQNMAKTATGHGQNGHEDAGNLLTISHLQDPKENIKKKETPISPKKEQCKGSSPSRIAGEQIIAFLNETTGKSFKPSTKGTQRLIKARLNEGFTVEDFKAVIKVKSRQWKGDTTMDGFLRPQTLFSNKFESYLQEFSRTFTSQSAFGFEDHGTGIRGYGL